MRKRVLPLVLLLSGAQASAQPVAICKAFPFLPQCKKSVPRFQFAASSGAGMGAVCSGTAITGSAGQVVTFTRASAMSCLRHGETTGIANGDMVMLAANQPAVQPGGDGSGAVGLSAWESRTNSTPNSMAFDAWTLFSNTSNPVVTANNTVDPLGTTTADEVVFAATAGGQYSFIYQLGSCPLGLDSVSVFIRGKSGSGSTNIAIDNTADGWLVGQCNFVSTSWTRCLMEAVTVSSLGSLLVAVGNMSFENGGISMPSVDVALSGFQCEAGSNASPFMLALDGGTFTRAAQTATASYTAAGTTLSIGGTFTPISYTPSYVSALSLSLDANNESAVDTWGGKNACVSWIGSTPTTALAPGLLLTPGPTTVGCGFSSTKINPCASGSCLAASDSLTLPAGASIIHIGGSVDGGSANATVKNVCVDPSASKCLPPATAVTCPAAESSNVALIGDSIMVGRYEVKVVDAMNGELCPNGKGAVSYAVSGATTVDVGAQYHTSVKGHAYRAVATDCGTNTLIITGDVAASWAAAESLFNDITQDGGFHLVLGNLTPCRGYSTCGFDDYTKVAAFNAHEADWCADAGSRATCIDNYALLGSGSQTFVSEPAVGALGNLCLPSSDFLHPNDYCTTKLAHNFAANTP